METPCLVENRGLRGNQSKNIEKNRVYDPTRDKAKVVRLNRKNDSFK